MSHHAVKSEADSLSKPGKPVASADEQAGASAGFRLEDGVWSLALASGHTSAEAQTARRTYLNATRQRGEFARLFRLWWQERTLAPVPQTSTLQPWVTEVHQRIAAVLDELDLLGTEPLRLPCYGCGRIFTSKPPRFARSCGACQPYVPAEPANPRGSRPMDSEGFYPAGPYRAKRGQTVLCAHPDCIHLFLSNRSDREYCDEHASDRKAVARAKERTTAPKHERYRFVPHQEAGPVRVQFMIGDRERACQIGPNGYQARDEPEFIELLNLAASGQFRVEPISLATAPSKKTKNT